jgi:hypothetical protein
MWKKYTFIIFFFVCTSCPVVFSEESPRQGLFEVEAGALFTNNMLLSGYNQANATSDWDSFAPTARLEYWSVKKDGWNYGVVAQPLFASYSGTLSSDFNTDESEYKKNESGSLSYQFHTLRGTANYPIVTSADKKSYLRVGGSLVTRYVDIKFKAGQESFQRSGFIAFPVANFEGELFLDSDYSLFTRTDFFPASGGEGLYDSLIAVRNHFDTSSVDFGVRLFFGGYDPDEEGKFANKIFYTGAVIRYLW